MSRCLGRCSCVWVAVSMVALGLLAAGSVEAHAPLSRALALSPGGAGGVAVRLPGFGFVLRTADDAPFRYACDALLGLAPTEEQAPFAFGPEGSLLVGTARGLRALDPQGCPKAASAELGDASVTRLIAHPDEPSVIYAVTSGDAPALFVSDDGGEHWSVRAELARDVTVTALVPASGDRTLLYLSEVDAEGVVSIAVASDGGQRLTRFEQDAPRVLLHAAAGDAGGGAADDHATLWAMTRDAATRMVAIERAPGPRGPWTEALRVHFFGGFAVDTRGEQAVIWVGDEGGSVFRSDDGGDSFEDAHESVASACLLHGREALWSCTPNSTQRPALSLLRAGMQSFEPVMALADVDAMVACAPEQRIEAQCAQAWLEWRVDVRMEDATAANAPDAGTGQGLMPDAGVATEVADPSDPPVPRVDTRGCRVAATLGSRSGAPPIPLGVVLALALAGLGLAARAGARVRRHGHDAADLARVVDSHRPASYTRVLAVTTLGARARGAAPPASDPTSDAALAARAQLGDVEAFALLYDRHAPAALALLQRMLSSAPEAEDVLHDVFLEAWQAVRAYDRDRGSVRTWLLLRARARGLDRVRRRAREPRPIDTTAPGNAAAHRVALDPPLERGLVVRRALEGLDAAVRETLELTYYAGMTALEIGEHMKVPEGTVRSRLARGLRALDDLLREVGGTRDGR